MSSNWEKAFSATPPGCEGAAWKRIVIHLEALPDEGAAKLEFTVGKYLETDGVNRVRLSGSVEEKTLQGWGYHYYVATSDGAAASTRMAPLGDSPPSLQFVGMQPLLVRYNSRLPCVVYVPEGFAVRYRLWKAEPDSHEAQEG